ncbi:1-acyl-sn-glycerol-3-phosphate acyltransferase [Denitrovibrio acetiphilus DSM 12809]|uniref:1-acyl-sn-glycerol-3-phosphate acyltransferase n=1 Tax=Denitrovibrio acetiphilus (strain DSM 12809 / NBRC 114555 / N2460) TaxID=522772 RepID=D4H860_DENA2|nr:lysophospholipid acyltransferase family protein [Denitrovibrio acetiphilus]ADD68209.1 1-acyl-sn-glycerol-3-phosphate acyltransferase [Denitrovibrio acetiphilus DSM 12809]
MKIIYSAFVWIALAFHTVILVLIGMPFLLVGINIYLSLARLWAKINIFLFGVRAKVEGVENLSPDRNYVFMGNHQSYVDIFVLLSVIDKRFTFMAKEELFKIPVFGFGIRAIGLVPINRGESRDALKSLFAAAKKIQEGYSIVLFPEGTRSDDGNMLPFKRGAFTLAVRTGHEIAPFVIEGSGETLPKSSFKINPFQKVTIRFLEPVSPEGMKDRELLELIRKRMESEQKELRNSGAGK